MAGHKFPRKKLKICCGVTLFFLIIIVIVCVTLFFTVFKPKDPQVIPHLNSLDNIEVQIFPYPSLNVTLKLIITIKNPNYGSFKYMDSKAYLIYRGNYPAGEILIEHGTVPSRGELNISSYADITGDKFITSPYFLKDIEAGSLNFTSTATLHGKVKVLNIFKTHATVFSYCDISILVQTLAIQLSCHSKVRL